MEGLSLRFVEVARALAAAARAERLVAPAFRSPPRLVGVSRSICRRRDGTTIAVVLRSRPWAAVLADMVEGVVVANRLRGVAADRCRAALWHAVETLDEADGGTGTAVAAERAQGGRSRDVQRHVGGAAA
jgi:hypothetical protein